MTITVGVLALQGAFQEHLVLLRRAADFLKQEKRSQAIFSFIEVRNAEQLNRCDALIIPGGESTTISLIAEESGLLEPLRSFVKIKRKPTWGTCAGLILLAEAANASKKGGQELIGGLDVRVNRNHFGRQIESFQADLDLPFLDSQSSSRPFPGVFIRAPIVEKMLANVEGEQKMELGLPDTVVAPSRAAQDASAKAATGCEVEVMGVLPGRVKKAGEDGAAASAGEEMGDIIAVRQGNVFGTSFHPELTSDRRLHVWWLEQIVSAVSGLDE